MSVTLDDRVRVNPDVLYKELDGEAVLLDLKSGTYFGLDPIGTAVWQALVQHTFARPAIPGLLDAYDVEVSVLEADVVNLLNDLSANHLIERDR